MVINTDADTANNILMAVLQRLLFIGQLQI